MDKLHLVTANLDKSIFGFSDFISVLALMIVVYTITDIKYRFRVSVSSIPLFRITYIFIIIIGLATLLIDVWYANKYQIFSFLDHPILIQGILAFLFLFIVLLWIYCGFISPPKFGKYNYKKYTEALYRLILKGSEQDLSVIADEIARSADNIVYYCKTGKSKKKRSRKLQKPQIDDYAYELLLLIGNRKFCKSLISNAPGTAILFFESMSKHKKYNLPINQFVQNITMEALVNTDSILYHEDNGFNSGLIGYIKPFSKSLYGNASLVEALSTTHTSNSVLDIGLYTLNAKQLKAYTRCVLIFIEDYLRKELWHQHSYVLHRSLGSIERSCSDLYKLKNMGSDYWKSDIYEKLGVVISFVNNFIKLINDTGGEKPKHIFRKQNNFSDQDLYDKISSLIFEIIFDASCVSSPVDTCWSIQYCKVWSGFFGITSDGVAQTIIKKKLVRLIYNEIKRLENCPNYKSVKVLGFCLNVLGVKHERNVNNDFYEKLLRKFVIKWTEKNYLNLRSNNIDVANNCLLGSISFDEKESRIVKTYEKGLNKEAPKDFLYLKK